MNLSDVVAVVWRTLQERAGRETLVGIDRFDLTPSEIPAAEQRETPLHELYYQHEGPLVHKWRNYLTVYDRHLSRFRGRPFRLLELGVSKGGSLALWRKYFGPEATIFGIDIDPKCAVFDGRDGQVRIGSQADRRFLAKVVSEMGGVDVVIDDGSHVASHQRKSLDFLLPQVSADGVYICEDVHTSYWPGGLEGGYRRPSAFIEVAKRIIDDMHADFHGRREGLKGASRSIDGIHFYNSIVVIEKKPQPAPGHTKMGVAQS